MTPVAGRAARLQQLVAAEQPREEDAAWNNGGASGRAATRLQPVALEGQARALLLLVAAAGQPEASRVRRGRLRVVARVEREARSEWSARVARQGRALQATRNSRTRGVGTAAPMPHQRGRCSTVVGTQTRAPSILLLLLRVASCSRLAGAAPDG